MAQDYHKDDLPSDKANRSGSEPVLLRILDAYCRIGSVLTGAIILFTMAIICIDVASRELWSRPIAGVPEIVRFGIVTAVFLQGAATVAQERMTSSDMFLSYLTKSNRNGMRVWVQRFHLLVGAALFAIIGWAVSQQVERSFTRGEYYGAQNVFELPVWPLKVAVALGAVAIALRYLAKCFAANTSE